MCESPAATSSLLSGILKPGALTREDPELNAAQTTPLRGSSGSGSREGLGGGGGGRREGSRACSVGRTKFFFFFPPFFFFRSQVGSFLHSTTSGRWEDVIASALLPPPVGGGENPIWSKSVESRDGARTGRPAPPSGRTSPGRRALPGTVIGPAPLGQPRAEPPPAAGPLLLLSAVPAAPPRACFSPPLPYRRPLPKSPRSARSRALGAPARLCPSALRRSLPAKLACAPLLPDLTPRSRRPASPSGFCGAPFISSSSPQPNPAISGDVKKGGGGEDERTGR